MSLLYPIMLLDEPCQQVGIPFSSRLSIAFYGPSYELGLQFFFVLEVLSPCLIEKKRERGGDSSASRVV